MRAWGGAYVDLTEWFVVQAQSQPQLRLFLFAFNVSVVEEWLWPQKSVFLVVSSVDSTVEESLSKSSFLHEVLSRFSTCAA